MKLSFLQRFAGDIFVFFDILENIAFNIDLKKRLPVSVRLKGRQKEFGAIDRQNPARLPDLRPTAKNLPKPFGRSKSRNPGLNRGPTHYECVALPTELIRHSVLLLWKETAATAPHPGFLSNVAIIKSEISFGKCFFNFFRNSFFKYFLI